MKYNYEKVKDINFCCIDCLISEMLNDLDLFIIDNHKSVSVVGDSYLISNLMKRILNIESEEEMLFDPVIINYDDLDYDNLYYLTINSDFELFVEKAWHEDNKWHDAGYLYTENNITYIYEDCNSAVLHVLNNGKNNIVIFGLDEE